MLGSNPNLPRYVSLLLLLACGPQPDAAESETEAPPSTAETGDDTDASGSTAATVDMDGSDGTSGSDTGREPGTSGETETDTSATTSTTGLAEPVAAEVWRRTAFTDEEQAWIFDLRVLPDGEVLVPWSRNHIYQPERWRRFSSTGDPLGDIEPTLFPSALGARVIDGWLPTSAGEIVFCALAEDGQSHRLVRIDLDGTTLEEVPITIDGADTTIEAMAADEPWVAIVSEGDGERRVAIVDETALFEPFDTVAGVGGAVFADVAWLGSDVVVSGGVFPPRMGQPVQRSLWRVGPDGAVESFVGPDDADNWYAAAAALGDSMLLIDDAQDVWLFDGVEVAPVDLGRLWDVSAADGGWLLAPTDESPARKVNDALDTLFVAEPTVPMWPAFVAADGPALLTLESPEDSRQVDLVRYAR